jgi:DNA-binding protein HU-beta
MTKAELVKRIATADSITKMQAKRTVDGFVSAVSSALANGDKIILVGFGTFSVGLRSQREGRNPSTGEKIMIPATKIVKFKAGKGLNERLK